MKRISYYIFTLLSILGIALQSCTDEIQYPDGRDEQPMRKGITLRIPDPEGMTVTNTRALKNGLLDLAEKEGTIKNLYLIAFSGDDEIPVIKEPLTGENTYEDTDHPNTAEGQREFDLTEIFKEAAKKEATWKVYVAANIDAYLPDGKTLANTTIDKESDLIGIKLNFFKTVDGKEKYLLDPALIEENGLPMICLASEMMVRYKDGEALQSAAGGITIAPSTNAEIHADLSFLCAKVRYTLLFDNSSFSKEIFENRSWNLTGVTASNLYNEPYSLDGTVNGNAVAKGLKNLPEDERAYPTNANINDYPTEEQAFVDLDDPASDAFPKRCFQGVFYFPGNDGSKALTSLSFEALEQHKDKDNNVKDGAKLTYKMDLLPKKVDDSKAIVNSHAYDVVAKVTGLQDIEAEVKAVQAWTPRSLVYSLMPPTYLKVDKTVVDMVAGDETEIEYETNAANISIESPKYTVNGTPQPLYELIKTADGKMYVTVSSKVPVSAYSGINSAIAANNYNKQYHYFYIIAGNIRKKIDIENLTLQRFLTVDPINITIDAREKIASGEYAGDIEVTIRTNLDKIYLNTGEKDENNNDVRQWGTITNGKSNCLSLTNTSNNGKLWENGNNQEYIVTSDIQDGVLKLKIHFDRINTNGETFWSSSKVLTFVVSCDNTGNPGDPDYLFPEKVNVNLLPNNDNYTIYFNAPSGWTDPHIYIYQCLELPMYLGEREINTGAKPDLSSYPVGYQIKDNDGNVVAANAALEYLFSGGVAFKGWDADENKSALSELNKGWIERGFYMFKDGTQESCSWNPADSKSDNRYYKDLDFNTEHRKLTICSSCGTIRNGYPGIGMYKVKADDSDPNTDWWKFELSGIATPGKALIMFADGHNGDDNKRFPGKNINGIPLFDHPNRIGYLNLADGYETFSQTPSGVNETESITTIYFTNPNNWTNVYVYMWGDSGANGAWKATKMTKINNNLWSYDIPTDKTYTQVIFYDGTTDNVGDHKTNNLAISSQFDTYNMSGAFKNTSYNGNGGGNNEGSYYIISYKKENDGWPENNGMWDSTNTHRPTAWPGKTADYTASDRRFWLYSKADLNNISIENYTCKASNNGDRQAGYEKKVSTMTKKSYDDLPEDVKNWLNGKSINNTDIIQVYYHDW